MSDDLPEAVETGRKVSMALLVTAWLLTTLLVVLLVASWITAPVVV
ncbi:hypothetical protein KCV87_31605 [Actinosynnema pretiosum subsp. pretiosum]|uniref:Uncharacterized protein n=1 Tax=Actinosynnema pretiosum subsp. pretiosum TaxID=103721 RepID=A0AA45L635_9PSEU|nr:hypothetical protein APASM_4818 [Actinosynnema pretiosum subsp. pretiosum]QUF03860.1 hypothetical protein KCV87_31605 [Actinosynnema pretiosum subsp. pretiosum]